MCVCVCVCVCKYNSLITAKIMYTHVLRETRYVTFIIWFFTKIYLNHWIHEINTWISFFRVSSNFCHLRYSLFHLILGRLCEFVNSASDCSTLHRSLKYLKQDPSFITARSTVDLSRSKPHRPGNPLRSMAPRTAIKKRSLLMLLLQASSSYLYCWVITLIVIK